MAIAGFARRQSKALRGGFTAKITMEGRKHNIDIHTHLVAGHQVEAIVEFLRQEKMDLSVIGLHRYTPRAARLWSTLYALEQEAPCSILGVH